MSQTDLSTKTGRPASKYNIVAREIEKCLKNKEFVDKLPGAHELAERFNVNFKTANKAISSLVEKGVLELVRGKGAYVAGSVEGRKTKTVAILMRARGHVFGEMAENLSEAILKKRHTPVVFDILQKRSTEAYLRKQLDKALEIKPDILILEGICEFPYRKLKKLEKKFEKIIIIYSFDSIVDIKADYILADPWLCAYKAVKHLIEGGRKRILFLAPRGTIKPLYYRHSAACKTMQGYRMALEEHGLQKNEMTVYDNLVSIGLQKEGEYEKYLERLLSGKDRPDAVFSYGDSRLKVFYDIAAKVGLKIPDDLALVGAFNTPWCEMYPVPLSSVSIRPDEIVRLALQKLTEGSKEKERIFIEPELIVRESSSIRKKEDA